MNTTIVKEFDIEQPIAKVWDSLANPEKIVTCVPGASITEKIDDKNYKGAVVTKFGPIKASYAGDIEIVELDEANRKMVLKGRGLDSKGKGSADMIMNGTLTEEGGMTHVNFQMDITIVGMLAQFGSRLINDVSDQLLNQFVDNFKKQLSGEEVDNTMNAGSMIGTVAKSIFGGKKQSLVAKHPKELIPLVDKLGYVIEEEMATVLFLMMELVVKVDLIHVENNLVVVVVAAGWCYYFVSVLQYFVSLILHYVDVHVDIYDLFLPTLQ